MPTLRVLSFNVRYDTPEDGCNSWAHRQHTVADILQRYQPTVFGLQESLRHQVEWLASQLPGYAWVGRGRSPTCFQLGQQRCEYNPIFYDTHHLDCIAHGTFWLSNMPRIHYTKFRGAALPRIATWARLKFKRSGQQFVFICTHFDHEGEEARCKSAQLLVDKLSQLAVADPVTLVGDLNAGAQSDSYRTIRAALKDASDAASGCCRFPCSAADGGEAVLPSHGSTFCCFDGTNNSVIDFIFVSHAVDVLGYGVIPDKCPNGACPSDHRPILADLKLP